MKASKRFKVIKAPKELSPITKIEIGSKKGFVNNQKENWRRWFYIQQQGRCIWCGVFCNPPPYSSEGHQDNDFTMEHLRPIAQGGSYDRFNLAGACYLCNVVRGRSLGSVLGEREMLCDPPLKINLLR